MRGPLLCLLLLSLAPAGARAADDPDTEVARRHFEQARVYYARKDYERALREFQAAKRVKPLPAFDYNIGLCNDRLERYAEAIAAYESYVSATPPPPDAAETRERVKVLRARLDTPATVAPPAMETPPVPVEPPRAEPPRAEPAAHPEPPAVAQPMPSLTASAPAPDQPPARSRKKTIALVAGLVGGAIVIGGVVALAVLLSSSSSPAYTPSTLGIWPGTR